jgi:hypothetical protein
VQRDYVVEVRVDVLEEIDGPMLKHGLQGVPQPAIRERAMSVASVCTSGGSMRKMSSTMLGVCILAMACGRPAAATRTTEPPTTVRLPNGDLLVALVDGLTDERLGNIDVDVQSDNGIRCVQAPCPTNSKHWKGGTDEAGLVTIPADLIQYRVNVLLHSPGYKKGFCRPTVGKPCRVFPDFATSLSGEITDAQAKLLVDGLKSPDPEVVRVAQLAFVNKTVAGGVGGAAAVALLRSPDRRTRLSAIKAFENGGNASIPAAIDALTPMLSDSDQEVRFAVAHVLSAAGGQKAPPRTLDVLLEEFAHGYPPGSDGRTMTHLSLRWRDCLPTMTAALRSPDTQLRDRASFVLADGLLLSTEADVRIVRPIVDTLFDTLLHDDDRTVRSRMVSALGYLARWNDDVRTRLKELRTADPATNDQIRVAVHNTEVERARNRRNK